MQVFFYGHAMIGGLLNTAAFELARMSSSKFKVAGLQYFDNIAVMDKESTRPAGSTLNIRAFALALGCLAALLALIISIWSRKTGFAAEFWQVYQSLHPTPFPFEMVKPTGLEYFGGVLVDVVYSFLDGFIFASIWAALYNLFVPRPQRAGKKD